MTIYYKQTNIRTESKNCYKHFFNILLTVHLNIFIS